MKRTLKRILLLAVVLTAAALLFSFTANALSKGDIDKDKTVTPADARFALRIAVGLPKSTASDGTTLAEFTEEEKDIADMDGDFEITPADARVVLRIAVGLEPSSPYYSYQLLNPPTCLDQGMNLRTNTESPFDKYYQYIPALGHDFSDLKFVKKAATCYAPGFGTYKCVRCTLTEDKEIIVDHEWSEATCTSPSKCMNEGCTAVNGAPLGHTTRLGECSRCHQFQKILYDYYDEKIRTPLNDAVKMLNEAKNTIINCRSNDLANKTNTLDNAIPYYKTAYNYYYAAYKACEGYDEFKEVEKQIYDICQKLLEIVYSHKTTAENYETQFSTWLATTTEVLSVRNQTLRIETDKFKEPSGNSGTGDAVG